jgi:hypothetical protein
MAEAAPSTQPGEGPGPAADSGTPAPASPRADLPRRMRPEPPGNAGPATAGWVSRGPARREISRPASDGPGTTGTGAETTWTGSASTGTGPAATEATGTGSRRTGSSGTGSARTQETGAGLARPYGPDRAAIRPAPGHAREAAHAVAPAARRPAEADAARQPWYEVAHAKRVAEGYQNCGPLERVLRREWPPSKVPSAPVVRAVNRLAELPLIIKQILAAGVDAIHVGEGGVPELDDMSRLRGVPLPSGRATWDACAGAYGEKKIIVGSRPSSAPDVMCHEVGHALDDVDREKGRWQSDSAEFRRLYERCEGSLVSDFHKQAGDLGRREFFADAFAAIASRQRPALVDMLGGNIRTALDVMLYFNLRYGL